MSSTVNIIRLPTAATNPVRQGNPEAVRAFMRREGWIGSGNVARPPSSEVLDRSPALALVMALLATADDAWGRRAVAFARLLADKAPDAATVGALETIERIFPTASREVVP